ncbi:SDR family NAD(P)-dependent oxidoreductase [Puniceicoccus vermicola]|uniref:3-oxoacyl-ACP reductase FabG n=1 Tax=Puniceicoccus vermicola TaxID=388746 RepID=A0A7X1AZM0_9BACT|nr:3-oxoacyl-ACP reductase family protein [Puniceicoccus vermicola]MBC2602724.1 3-oxoacyl-ACP reductase FabG [Puniceicoccus vermicola]
MDYSHKKSPFDLSGRIALVTGSARGLGRAIAEELSRNGASVIVNDLRAEGASATLVGELKAEGHKVWNMAADVSDEIAVNALFEKIVKDCGRLDFLVNNAGTAITQDIFETSTEEWDRILDTNLKSCFLCSKRAMELMRDQKFGRIVNIASVVAHRGAFMGPVHYAASKSGMLGITKTLARTGAPLGINVNAVAPGIILTELLERSHGADGIKELAKSVPLGVGAPRDVGMSVAFLCSAAADYITGATLDVNGGMYLR